MNEYEVRVTRQALEQMKIKQEQKPLEYFERMLPSYDEYVREKYPESIELGNELSKQESKSTILQQNDGMYNIANDEVNKVQNPVSDNLLDKMKAEITKLSSFPKKHALIDEEPWRTEGVREIVVKNSLIYY